FVFTRFTRPLSRRLSGATCELARASREAPNLSSAALSFVAFARLLEGEPERALALARESSERLAEARSARPYEAWAARAVEAASLVAMGRAGEAARVFEENARRAREVGDELAVVAGDSPLRHLVCDDVPRARALLERKRAV